MRGATIDHSAATASNDARRPDVQGAEGDRSHRAQVGHGIARRRSEVGHEQEHRAGSGIAAREAPRLQRRGDMLVVAVHRPEERAR